jgi:hypothetical protein
VGKVTPPVNELRVPWCPWWIKVFPFVDLMPHHMLPHLIDQLIV